MASMIKRSTKPDLDIAVTEKDEGSRSALETATPREVREPGRPLQEAGIEFPHIARDAAPSPAMFVTDGNAHRRGLSGGPLVVGLKIVPDAFVVPRVSVTSRHPDCHGAPVHIGDPAAIGIRDTRAPDRGDGKAVPAGHTAMFWARGLTAQAAAMASGIPEMITQTVGRMFVTDLPVLAAL